jgi:hypothetical protein
MMIPPPVLLFDLPKLLSLLISQVCRDLLVRFSHDLMDTTARVAPYLPKLHGRFVDDWRDLRDLFWS